MFQHSDGAVIIKAELDKNQYKKDLIYLAKETQGVAGAFDKAGDSAEAGADFAKGATRRTQEP